MAGKSKNSILSEVGRIGQKRWGGTFDEEFLKELRGIKGIETYKEMADNDDIIGAILFAIENLIRQATWSIQPGGNSEIDNNAAEFVESCMNDMSDTWTDTISEILSYITFGFSVHEIVYKRRNGKKKDRALSSKYSDGLIGWKKLPIRAQESLYEWEYDDEDNLTAFVQMPAPRYEIIRIPIDKCLLFRTKSRKDNPEGRSVLRNAYRAWYFKKRIQEIEGIGIERDLAGLPVLRAPESVDIWDTDNPEMAIYRANMESIVQNIRRDALEGVALPNGWELQLLSTGGSRQFDTNAIIDRYDTRIAMTVLADFILVGHQQTGSFALHSDKTELFGMAIGTFLDIICEVFNNKAIPDLIDVNGEVFKNITDYPHMVHGDVEDVDLKALGTFIKDMTGCGALIPDDSLDEHIREIAHLPSKDNNYSMPASPHSHGVNINDIDTNDTEDELRAKTAKSRLGRRS